MIYIGQIKKQKWSGLIRPLAAGIFALLVAASLFAGPINPEMVEVGDAGNVPDVTGYGAVNYDYRIAAFEVTRSEYASFLNAVAATDTYGLHNPSMSISRSGSSGSYSYSAVDGSKPVAFVSWFDALRFVNWLHNGQPSGAQTKDTTEDGAYTFAGQTSVGPRNPGARFFLPSEDEWHKAAYYKGGTSGLYFKYATQSDILPTAETPPGASNSANFNNLGTGATSVGAYPGASGYYGTFDQAGNLWEWNESLSSNNGGLRGGSYHDYDLLLQASYRDEQNSDMESALIGFRVASIISETPRFALVVQNGSGSGSYTAGTIVPIVANAPPSGQVFDRWTGAAVANPLSASTTLTMTAANATVTATYKNQTYTLVVQNGSGSGSYTAGTIVPIVANAPPSGQIFDRWTGAAVANPLSASTTLTMTAANATVTATYKNQTYTLVVQNGGGSGSYTAGTIVPIVANAPPSGQIFDRWTGAAVANPLSASTTLTMTAANATVTATYKNQTYTLVVQNGGGSGSYTAGTIVPIVANAPPSGQIFDRWTGAAVANALSASTTLTMTAANATVTATYKNQTYTLVVQNGSGSGSYAAGTIVPIVANAPPSGQIFDRWTGAAVANALSASTTLTMTAANATVTATYKNQTYTLVVQNGSGSGSYTAGTVVPIVANAPPSGQIFDRWTGAAVANPLAASTVITMPAANATVTATYRTAPVPTYTLTVQNGSGSGSYAAGTIVPIVANAPPSGQIFDRWTGAAVANALSASTTITMPSSNVTVTANYKSADTKKYKLTVQNGSGSGSYAAGTIVPIVANTPPSGQVFNRWTGKVASVADLYAASTTLIMPAFDATVTATYATFAIVRAEWNTKDSVLRVQGKGPLQETVVIADPQGNVLGTSIVAANGTWDFRRIISREHRPQIIRATCKGITREAKVSIKNR